MNTNTNTNTMFSSALDPLILLKQYLKADPLRRKRFNKIRKSVGEIFTSNYDISNECNLTCEGCLFFEGDSYKSHLDTKTPDQYHEFWQKEKNRGINFPMFAGAEPSLKKDRLLSAAQYFDKGVIFTNGTIRLNDKLPFKIHISLWGDEETTKDLRGGAVFHKPLRTYAQDPRAIFIYTISKKNIPVLPKVVEICHSYGAKISFNHFSPTNSYLDKLGAHVKNDNEYFRISTAEDNLQFTEDDFKRARDVVDDLIEKYPDTVVFSHAYNHLITNPKGIYDIDPATGIARDCGSHTSDHHRHYHVDLVTDGAKCCTPNIDCRTCRGYPQTYGSLEDWFPRFLETEKQLDDWLEIMETWNRVFLIDWDKPNIVERKQPITKDRQNIIESCSIA